MCFINSRHAIHFVNKYATMHVLKEATFTKVRSQKEIYIIVLLSFVVNNESVKLHLKGWALASNKHWTDRRLGNVKPSFFCRLYY